MTAKKIASDSDEKPLLSSSPAAAPPSHQRNEDYDPKDDDVDYEEWILYSPELDIALEESVFLRALRSFHAQGRPHNTRRVYVENLPVLTRSLCYRAPSLCSNTESSSSSSTLSSFSRRVRFAEKLVTEVRLRPKTPPDERGKLFYSFDEIQRFRQDYRLERSVHHDNQGSTASSKSNGLLLNEEEMNSIFGEEFSEKKRQLNKYDISRVVVLHNNILETYNDDLFCSRSSGRLKEEEETFFDNDSFWSGSITWY
mmetsp:Transcript_14036/g.20103  ORF Transcript_14036/g.20103 Transcript_14036/m.20103 type:complete len:255 (+) Transcript_14036:42-806(+)